MQPASRTVRAKFENEREAWDRLYRRSDYAARGIQWRRDDGVALCLAHLPAGGRVLDLGCGCGHAALDLARAGLRVRGIDFSPRMVERARRNAEDAGLTARARFEVRDFASDPPPAASFDGLLALGFLEYFDDPDAVLRAMAAVLRPRGIAVVQVWNRRPLLEIALAPLDPVRARRGPRAGAPPAAAAAASPPDAAPAGGEVRHRRYRPRDLARLADGAGFDLIDARGSLFFPLHSSIAEAHRARWDVRLQRWAGRCDLLRRQAVNYVAALRKR